MKDIDTIEHEKQTAIRERKQELEERLDVWLKDKETYLASDGGKIFLSCYEHKQLISTIMEPSDFELLQQILYDKGYETGSQDYDWRSHLLTLRPLNVRRDV